MEWEFSTHEVPCEREGGKYLIQADTVTLKSEAESLEVGSQY